MGLFSSVRKGVATVGGKLIATVAWLETPSAELVPGPGQIVAEGQRMLPCTEKGYQLSSASLCTYRRVQIPGGTRTTDDVAVDLLGNNPKRVGFEIYAIKGTSALGTDDQVDFPTGRPLLPTNSREQRGIGIYTGPIFAADDGTHDCDLSVWEWSNP